MFEATRQTVESRRRSPTGFMLSFVTHAAMVAVVLAFGARQVDKAIEKVVDIKFYAPPPPPPPPPAASSRSRSRVEKIKVPTEIVQPQEVKPIEETTEDDPVEEPVEDAPGGVEGGDPDFGVLGGVLGGTPGGVIGGQLGGTGTSIADVTESEIRCTGYKDVEYPPLAKKQGITGDVVVEMIIGLDGRVESAKVVRGPTLFHQAVLTTARKTVCEPYRSGSVISRARLKYTYKFYFD